MKFLMLFALLFSALAGARVISVNNSTLSASQKNEMINTMANFTKNMKMPSLVVAATSGDKVIWYEGIGYADYEKKIKVKPNFHMYRWASVSKVATDRMIKALHEQGKVDIDKPISLYYKYSRPKYYKRCFTPSNLNKYFECTKSYGQGPISNIRGSCFDVKQFSEFKTDKNFSAWVSDKKSNMGQVVFKDSNEKEKCRVDYSMSLADLENSDPEITLRDILEHKSGIQHYGFFGNNSEPPTSKISDVSAIKNRIALKQSQMKWAIPYFFPKHPLITKPGKTKTYSTFAYNLAGRLLEVKSGKRYEDLLGLYAAKMGATSIQADYFGVPSQFGFSRSFVYKRENNTFKVNHYNTDNSYKLAGGGVMSTIVDMARFCVGIASDGYVTSKGVSSYSHSGAHSSRSLARLSVSSNKDGKRQCLVLMTNTNHSGIDLEKARKAIAQKLIDMGYWKK